MARFSYLGHGSGTSGSSAHHFGRPRNSFIRFHRICIYEACTSPTGIDLERVHKGLTHDRSIRHTHIQAPLELRPVFSSSENYRETRHANDGTSGVGSYGKFADFKAETL